MIPNTVMDELIVPLAHTGFEIQRHEAFAEEVLAGTRTTVEVARRRLDADVHNATCFVD